MIKQCFQTAVRLLIEFYRQLKKKNVQKALRYTCCCDTFTESLQLTLFDPYNPPPFC